MTPCISSRFFFPRVWVPSYKDKSDQVWCYLFWIIQKWQKNTLCECLHISYPLFDEFQSSFILADSEQLHASFLIWSKPNNFPHKITDEFHSFVASLKKDWWGWNFENVDQLKCSISTNFTLTQELQIISNNFQWQIRGLLKPISIS